MKLQLTKTQIEILKLKRAGLTHKEIAEVTFRSKKTVDSHLANIWDRVEQIYPEITSGEQYVAMALLREALNDN